MLTALLLVPLLLCGGGVAAAASTYFVDASAPNDSGNGSAERPKKFITSGIKLIDPGDTLVIKDGTYAGERNMIGDEASPRVWPPSGKEGKPTTIRAEHVGGAIIDGSYAAAPFSSVNKSGGGIDHLQIDGIHFRHGRAGVFNLKGSRNKITNCGFEDGMSPGSNEEAPIAFVAGGSSYTLVEDCWVWGRGRYGFYTSSTSGGTHHVVFRRVVVRLDSSPPWVTAGLRFYNAHDNVMQNCLVIDSLVHSDAREPSAFAQGGGSSSGDANNSWVGVMALNNPQMWGYNANDVLETERVTDSVFWGNHDGVFLTAQKNKDANSAVKLSRLTIGSNTAFGLRHNPTYAYTASLSDSLVYVTEGATAFKDPSSLANTVVYAAHDGIIGSKQEGYRSLEASAYHSGLKYLPRVEAGSVLERAGVGATILHRIGESGSCYGEPGWNTVSSTPLWPFPNEALWSAKMSAYRGGGPRGDRGFAGGKGTTPLSDYVWGYLGNPAPPFNVAALPGPGEVELQWDEKEGSQTTGYKIYAGTAPGRYDLPGYAGGKEAGKGGKAVVGKLPPGAVHYFAVTAVDKKGAESGIAYEVSAAAKACDGGAARCEKPAETAATPADPPK